MTIEALTDYGLVEMTDDEIRDLLLHRGVGVLGLPTGDVPYLIPMAFGFDGDEQLFFSYFLGERSRKEELSERARTASFLVYEPDSVFQWESVLLTGELDELPPGEVDANRDALENAWRLDLFDRADTAGRTKVYRFRIDERTGIKCTGLPPGLERSRE